MIVTYVTFGDLASWLAIRPLRALIDRTGVLVELHPLLGSLGNVVSTNMKPGETDPLARLKQRRAAARTAASKRERARQCEMLGISLEAASRDIDPLMLSVGLNWLRQRGQGQSQALDYIGEAFAQLYSEIPVGELESPEGVVTLLRRLNCPVDRFHEFAVAEAGRLEEQSDALLEAGILSAPAFVVDGEIYHGRQHLPLINWMMSDKTELPPV